jgi:hydrogenase nickel incorporation protein HypB
MHHEHGHEHGHAHDASEDGWHSHTAADGSVSWHRHGGHGAQQILDANQREAERNRGFFRARGILALNLVSSPGSGKTTLLQATLERLQARTGCAVVVGDLETQEDAEALRPSGVPVIQITTGTVCHLDARMVAAAVDALPGDGVRLLFIENVGNLVCPASFDLGEAHRIVLLAATEGENKPLKYPPIFHGARAVVISKTDLAEPAGFDIVRAPSDRTSRSRGGNHRSILPHRRMASMMACVPRPPAGSAWLLRSCLQSFDRPKTSRQLMPQGGPRARMPAPRWPGHSARSPLPQTIQADGVDQAPSGTPRRRLRHPTLLRCRLAPSWRVYGIVQGVGFRPWLCRTARALDLTGETGNDAAGVWLEAQGERGGARYVAGATPASPAAGAGRSGRGRTPSNSSIVGKRFPYRSEPLGWCWRLRACPRSRALSRVPPRADRPG